MPEEPVRVRRQAFTGPHLEWWMLACAVAVVLASRLAFLPTTLEDIDSLNFDLGVHHYDPVHHQPHPPGYPVYIFLARSVHSWFDGHAPALAFVSAVLSALVVVPLYLMLQRLLSAREAVLACTLILLNPIVWFNSVRPMSDLTGFAVVTTTQWILLRAIDEARPGRRTALWLVGVALGGISIGTRLQAVWLVGPVLLYGLWRLQSIRMTAASLLCGAAAIALWLVPLLEATGGLAPFLESFGRMVGNSWPVEPLVTGVSMRRAVEAAVDVTIAPWRIGPGVLVAVLAAIGAVRLLRGDRRAAGILALLFLPYALYHFSLQATAAMRYAIPVVPLLASLAAVGVLRGVPHPAMLPGSIAVAIGGAAAVTLPALAAYAATPSPPFQALARIEQLGAQPGSVVVTGHHIFERYLAQVPNHDVLLPLRGARQTLMAYWNEGGRKPVLFLQHSPRNTLLLFGEDRPHRLGRWRWPRAVRPFMRGERPGRVDLVRLDPPRWFTESGFLIADEAGGVDDLLRETPVLRVRGSVRRRPLVISGFLRDSHRAEVAVTAPASGTSRWQVGDRFSVNTWLDPASSAAEYLPVTVQASAEAVFTDVWVDNGERPFVRPSHGFYLPERDADAGLFRWMGPAAVATAYLPARAGRLTVEGSIPDRYYRLPVVLSLEWNGAPLGSLMIATASFRGSWLVPGSPEDPWGRLVLRVSQSFVPNTVQRNGDRRTLAARVYNLALEPAPVEPH